MNQNAINEMRRRQAASLQALQDHDGMILCMEIVYPGGERVWEPILEQIRNPRHGTFVRRQPKQPDFSWRDR